MSSASAPTAWERVKSLLLGVLSPRDVAPAQPTSVYRQPVIAFGAVMVAMIWSGAALLLFMDSHALRTKAERDAVNFARVGQQNANGLLNGVDARLRELRTLDAVEAHHADWNAILSDSDLLNGEEAEMAVVDRDGFLIASTRDPHPSKLVDVAALPFFADLRDQTTDSLFFGLARGGRDGDAKLRVSLRRVDAKGEFAGVVVFSFPADYFDRQFSGLDLGVDGGLALVGEDGRIRSGSGVFADRLGERLDHVREALGDDFLGEREVAGFPLKVVARLSGLEANPGWRLRRALVVAGAALASALVIAATIRVARRRTRFEREILHISRHDALTGLPNRHALSTELERLCAEGGDGFALHVLDLDRFKAVNDTYGHVVGDELLRLAAGRLRSVTRAGDMVARLGGDEFAILQKIKNFENDAMALARRVNQAMAQPFNTSRQSLSIGATVGAAQGGRDGASAVDLMKAADLALYAAKADGRGGARLFQNAMTEATRARVDLENGLRDAMERGELFLDYQPIHGLRRPGLRGFEALLRWRREDGKLVPPNRFIPIAEDLGLIGDIGAWAMRRACADAISLPEDLEISVNVSPAQLDDGRFVACVRDALNSTGLPPQRLRIEITESALLRDKPVVSEQIRMMRDMGVGVSLDDFGTGYSCLSYLEMYPIDTLKIDQRFVRKLGARPEAAATLRAIVDLARSYGMNTVAEGVETEEQLRALKEVGCDRAQGYLLGRPGPLRALPAPPLESAA